MINKIEEKEFLINPDIEVDYLDNE